MNEQSESANTLSLTTKELAILYRLAAVRAVPGGGKYLEVDIDETQRLREWELIASPPGPGDQWAAITKWGFCVLVAFSTAQRAT